MCLGKPGIGSGVTSLASVKDVLTALKKTDDKHVSVWRHGEDHQNSCIANLCIADVICFLCKDHNLTKPFLALQANVSHLLPNKSSFVKHLQPNSSLLEAIDCILEGTQNIVIPREHHDTSSKSKKEASDTYISEYCWLTQSDVARFLLDSPGAFSPIPTYRIDWLNIIERNVMTIHYDDPASMALPLISRTITKQTCVAVIDDDKKLRGEICPRAISFCDEKLAAAILTLSAGDLLEYINCGVPPEDLIQLMNKRLKDKGLSTMLQILDEPSTFSSDSSTISTSNCSSEAIICHPWSSLLAVMVQALTHQATCVWVVDEHQTLVGIVTFQTILKVLRLVVSDQHKEEKGNSCKQ